MIPFQWAGHEWQLYSEKALLHRATKTIFVTDLHFGKDQSFRHHGFPIPEGDLANDLNRLENVLQKNEAAEFFILGDFFHADTGTTPELLDHLNNWFDKKVSIPCTLIRGNHDRRLDDAFSQLPLKLENEPYEWNGFHLSHHPPNDIPEVPTLVGHVHPAVKFRAGAFFEKNPCFYFDEMVAYLPSFGSFTGNYCLPIKPQAHIFLIHQSSLMQIQ